MKKELSIFKSTTDTGFSIVEVILASALFVMIVTTFIGAYLYGQESTALSGSRARATLIAEEGLEAVRNIRDNNFDNLDNGTHGLSSSNKIWELDGSDDTTDIFTREIEISEISNDEKEITSTVTWQQTEQRDGIVTLTTTLTNWAKIVNQQTGLLAINIDSLSVGGKGNKEVINLVVENISAQDVVIDIANISWGNNKNIEEIQIDSLIAWSGTEPAGTDLDLTDVLIPIGGSVTFNTIKFSGNMVGETLSISLTLGDGSIESLGNISP